MWSINHSFTGFEKSLPPAQAVDIIRSPSMNSMQRISEMSGHGANAKRSP
jgi:hypothetical protein